MKLLEVSQSDTLLYGIAQGRLVGKSFGDVTITHIEEHEGNTLFWNGKVVYGFTYGEVTGNLRLTKRGYMWWLIAYNFKPDYNYHSGGEQLRYMLNVNDIIGSITEAMVHLAGELNTHETI